MDLHARLLNTAPVIDDTERDTAPPRRPFLVAGLTLAALVVAAVWAIFSYVDHERARDLRNWQARLDLIASDRAERIEQWLQNQHRVLQELSSNASLQLYLSQLQFERATADEDTEPAQLGYLRNLIRATALNHGFYRDTATMAGIGADLPQAQPRGLGLVDGRGKLVVATPGMPPVDPVIATTVQRVLETGQPDLIDLHRGRNGAYLLGFASPVAPVKGVQTEARQVGAALGLRSPDEALFGLVTARTGMLEHDETLLVEQQGDSVVYLSPLADGTRPLERRLALTTPGLAGAIALRSPGRFAEAVDYAGTPVLMTSRAVAGTPWVLIQKTPAALVLKETNQRRRTLLATALLTLFLITAVLIATWWHGTSIRTRRLAAELAQRSRQLEAKSRLLHSITDNVRDFIFILDGQKRFLYANQPLADACGIDVTEFRGKTLAGVLGPATARQLERHCPGNGAGTADLAVELDIGTSRRSYHCAGLRLPEEAGMAGARLLVLHDVTALQAVQRRHANLLRQLIQALVRAVDKHDPHSANHSARVTAVALAIGKAMELPAEDMQTLEMAASLANIGKLFVPKEILTKTGPLDDAEQTLLREHVQHALEMLKGLEFEGPVLETIAQKQEYMDGSGYPKGLAGEQILPTARILAVANAFVALVSPRAWRDAVPVPEALDRLLADSGTRYDRRVVAALLHIIENRPDWGLVELVTG